MFEPALRLLNAITPQPEAIFNYLKQDLTSSFIKNGQMLLKEGSVCEHIYFK